MRSVRDSEFVSMGGKEKELIVVDSGLLKLKDRGQRRAAGEGVNSGSLTGSCQAQKCGCVSPSETYTHRKTSLTSNDKISNCDNAIEHI